jgi:hypothetical protein
MVAVVSRTPDESVRRFGNYCGRKRLRERSRPQQVARIKPAMLALARPGMSNDRHDDPAGRFDGPPQPLLLSAEILFEVLGPRRYAAVNDESLALPSDSKRFDVFAGGRFKLTPRYVAGIRKTDFHPHKSLAFHRATPAGRRGGK